MSINLQLRKFDMTRIKDDKIVIMIGKRGTGKSWLIRDLMYHHRSIPVGAVISPTESSNGFFKHFIPKIFIHDEYHPSITANFMKRQVKMTKLIEKGEKNIDPRAYLIFDDCLYDNSWKNDKYIREVFLNGRHRAIQFLLSLQYAIGINPMLRTNVDFIFILRENIISNRRKLYEQYAGMFPTFEMFCSTMDQCTENYECLVIDNTIQSNKIEEQIFWYKSEPHPDFRVGPSEVWQYSDQNWNEDDDEEEGININTYGREKKKGPRLNIKKV